MKLSDLPSTHAVDVLSGASLAPGLAAPAPSPAREPGGVFSRLAIMAFLAGALAAGAVTILLVGPGQREPLVEAATPASPVAPSVAERWPGARLTTAAAATGLNRGVAPTPASSAPPVEALADVGPNLSPEWKLALAREGAFVERKPAPTERAAAPASPPLASGAPEAGASATRLDLQHGISMRVYRTGPDIPALLAECDKRNFFSRSMCRAQVCEPYLGKVEQCPLPEAPILH